MFVINFAPFFERQSQIISKCADSFNIAAMPGF